ncbi:MAG TPA: DUF998 domain-containing protein [Ktedonobacterales bacterium]|nr:DUF998 domain-containing protein [Ktedonobacterales bacterium]
MNQTEVTAPSTRWLLAGGVIGPVLFVLVFLVEGATRPGYSAWRNFVSQLSLSDQGWEQVANFLICGVLCLGFAIGLRRILRSGKGSIGGPILLGIFGLSLISAGIFVTGPGLGYPPGAPVHSQESAHAVIHALSGLLAFISLAAACFVLARRFAGDPIWRGWAPYSAVSGAIVAGFFVASVSPGVPAGLLQRIAIIAGWAWIAALAWRLLRSPRAAVAADVRPMRRVAG